MSDSDKINKCTTFVEVAQKASHDLNNSLFPILTCSELILEDQSDKQFVRESVSDINESVKKAIEILNDFITQIQLISKDLKS